MIYNIPRKTLPESPGLLCVAVAIACIAGCSSLSRSHIEPPPVVSEAPPVSDFTIAAGMLDTWNAVGQVLVHVDGVTYEGRAQMLGLYDVRYRDERFLIVTRALMLSSERQTMATKVAVALQDGKPDGSAAAIELLGLLQARLPEELQRIAASKVKRRKR